MRTLSAKERDETYTNFNTSMYYKLYIAMFLNTAIIPLVTKLNKDEWFGVGGLVVDIYLNVILANFITPIFYYFNFGMLIRKLRVLNAQKKGDQCTWTQRKANKLYEYGNFDIAKSYADYFMIMCTTVFYTPLMPFLPCISLIGIFCNYWWQKFLLFRRSKIPQHQGEKLAMLISQNIPFMMFVYALGQYLFISTLSEGTNQVRLPVLIVTIGYYFIPKDIIMRNCETSISGDDSETILTTAGLIHSLLKRQL